MKWLNEVAKQHKEWVRIVNSFGEDFFAEDIVQETYIMLMKWSSEEKMFNNGKVNKTYMWLSLRNTFLMHLRKSGKMAKVSLEHIAMLQQEPSEELKHESYSKILDVLDDEINNWHWYDQKLFKLYKDTDLSMRDISKETSISVTSIFHTIKQCKTRINESVGESYEDYKNGDYELIK
jgi:RNA polymerase sigma factor (sigma-70 family)